MDDREIQGQPAGEGRGVREAETVDHEMENGESDDLVMW
jgi:hypothetical protein